MDRTYSTLREVTGTGRLYTAVKPLHFIVLDVFIRYTGKSIFRPDYRVIPRPESEHDDVAGQCIDAVWREVVLSLADRDLMNSDLVFDHSRRGGIDRPRGPLDVRRERRRESVGYDKSRRH